MAKKSAAIGIVSAAAAGAGAAYLVRKVKGSEGPEAGKKKEKKEKGRPGTEPGAGYRNTELGKHEKTGKESITAAEIMKLLPGRRSRKAWRKRMPIL